MKVKRYNAGCAYAGEEEMVQVDDGAYVSHEDYAALLKERDALAVENAGLKSAFDQPQAYLSWHAIPPTWDEPLPCGEYLDAHAEEGHKNSDGTDCWPVFAKPEIETPATDAAIAAIQAQGVEKFVSKCKEESNRAHSSYYRDSWWVSGENADDFAAQLTSQGIHP